LGWRGRLAIIPLNSFGYSFEREDDDDPLRATAAYGANPVRHDRAFRMSASSGFNP
jgi:hypothetical protein